MNRLQKLKMMMLANTEKKGLPSMYQRVEYLQSTGIQYIDTGLKVPSSTYRHNVQLDLTVQITGNTSTTQTFISGSYNGAGGTWFGNVNGGFAVQNNYNVGASTIKSNLSCYYQYSTEKTIIRNNDSQQQNEFPFINGNNHNITLFATEASLGVTRFGSYAKIWNCQIYIDDEKVRDFVPCYRKSDNVAGMYNLVNDVFYTNAGTGEFIVGGEI